MFLILAVIALASLFCFAKGRKLHEQRHAAGKQAVSSSDPG
ncbi:hypothetical protein [Brevibacillus marinus]|nr:hypothetical protein [Brevibacillus marinus]